MTKFKAGDKAVLMSVEPGWGVEAGTAVKIKRPFKGSAGPGYMVELCNDPGSCIYYAERRLGPVDDPLPPAPESVRYYNSYILGNNNQHLTVEDAPEYPGKGLLHLLITPNSPSSRNVAPLSINMDAASALQLAHDLNRMANEIKRRERQQRKTTLSPAIVHPYGE